MSLKPENPSKDVNILKRKPKNAEMEEEIQLKQDLIPSKKRLLAEDRPSKSKIIPNQNIDYEESFKKHLGKQAELQKNIELFTKNVEDKILYDKGFSNSTKIN